VGRVAPSAADAQASGPEARSGLSHGAQWRVLPQQGCRWRALPKEYGPWQTVYHYFRLWRISGLWQELNDKLRVRERQAEGHKAQPSVGIIDSQSAKTTSKKGFAGTTRVKSSKAASGI